MGLLRSSLVGCTCKEVSAVIIELGVVDLGVNIEYHVLYTILVVFVGPFLVTCVFLGIVEVYARSRDDAGENE